MYEIFSDNIKTLNKEVLNIECACINEEHIKIIFNSQKIIVRSKSDLFSFLENNFFNLLLKKHPKIKKELLISIKEKTNTSDYKLFNIDFSQFLLEMVHDFSINYYQIVFEYLTNKSLLSSKINIIKVIKELSRGYSASILSDFKKRIQIELENNFLKKISPKFEFYKDKDVKFELLNLQKSNISNHDLKIALSNYKTKDDFFNNIYSLYEKANNWSLKDKCKYLDSLNIHEYLVSKSYEDILIIKINNFKELRKLGSDKWCIVKDESNWNEYIQNNYKQWILLNFNQNVLSNESLIGITIDDKGSIVYAYCKENMRVEYSNSSSDIPDDLDIDICKDLLKTKNGFIEYEVFLKDVGVIK